MDTSTRNALQNMVGRARDMLSREFQAQLEGVYGIQSSGEVASLDQLGHLGDRDLAVAELLRERLDHLIAGAQDTVAAVARLVREQAFTVLNRFSALRMAEERRITLECVRRGPDSEGFKLFQTAAGNASGDTFDAYRVYLEDIFDELSLDLGVLFDRYAPSALLFPRQPALEHLLEPLNQEVLSGIWEEDETIGWIYQFFNSPEERKKMREEAPAPRDSYELAVRNQFFTPRYVVRFLTDNTLGRLWLEMAGQDSALAQRCDLFVPDADPGQRRARRLRDPREIRLLDPACGSMHFGLYAFDVLEAIYEEAWDRHPGLLADLRPTVPSREAFLTLVPELIIHHNIHGIDIDRRAVQIAGLSLWLRAHRTYARLGIPAKDRPRIRRSGVVCAEPMPGEKKLLAEFMADVRPKVLGELAARVWEEMKLAGDVGSLLRIERTMEGLIAKARKAWETYTKSDGYVQPDMFANETVSQLVQGSLGFDIRDVEDEASWERMETELVRYLAEFAERTSGEGGYRRKLFAEDAASGFAFLDLLRHRYDVVLMNPPFGECAVNAKEYIKHEYPRTKQDLYAAFVESFLERLEDRGLLGAITSRTGFFLSTFQTWREEILLKEARPVVVADLGYGVLDAMVETAAYCLEKVG